jgi:phosphoribosylamine-glycine ligase
VCKYVEESQLANYLLTPLEDLLVKLGHIGDFDIEAGITKDGKIWPYECSARFGWPSTQILMSCHTSDPVEWMRDAAMTGRDSLEVDDRCSIGVVMAGPPFPNKNEDPQSSFGDIIDGIEEVWDHVSPWQLALCPGPVNGDKGVEKGEVYKRTGDYVCVVTARGADVHDIIPEVYAAVDKIKFPDRIVRNDVGKKLEKELPQMHALGFPELPQW